MAERQRDKERETHTDRQTARWLDDERETDTFTVYLYVKDIR